MFVDPTTSDLELLAALRAGALRNSELAYSEELLTGMLPIRKMRLLVPIKFSFVIVPSHSHEYCCRPTCLQATMKMNSRIRGYGETSIHVK